VYEYMRRHGGRSRILNSGRTRRVMKIGAARKRAAGGATEMGRVAPFLRGIEPRGRGWFALTAGGRAWGV
jgi:hypothetical protein